MSDLIDHDLISSVNSTIHSFRDILHAGTGAGNRTNKQETTLIESMNGDSLDVSGEGGSDATNDTNSQVIYLRGDDETNSFAIHGQKVDIVASSQSAQNSAPSSNKVKIVPVVTYNWETKLYFGNLIAIHQSGIYVAYILKKTPGPDGIVRLVNRKSAERVLLRNFVGCVCDIAFAYINSHILLACVDEPGSLFVYEITEDNGKMLTQCLLHIDAPKTSEPTTNHRVIWCPYIPEDPTSSDSPDDVGQLLVLTHDNKVEMWNVDVIRRELKCTDADVMKVCREDIEPGTLQGMLTITDHKQLVTDAAFSPDGTALATASADGYVKFFQVYMVVDGPQEPRLLHQWQPHGGKPLSALFFLDNHKKPNLEVQFWKFAMTGADNNSEIKLWSCESWTCLQTLSFLPSPQDDIRPCLKAMVDLSADYLIMSDMNRRVVYMLQLYQDAEGQVAQVSCISEFILAQSCLSLAALDVSRTKFKKSADRDSLDEITTGAITDSRDTEAECEYETPDGSSGVEAAVWVVAKIYSVFPKILQELQIRYEPALSATLSADAGSLSSLSVGDTGGMDEQAFRDGLSDMSMNMSMDVAADAECAASVPKPVLLGPEAFRSSPGTGGHDKSADSSSGFPMAIPLRSVSPTGKHEKQEVSLIDLDDQNNGSLASFHTAESTASMVGVDAISCDNNRQVLDSDEAGLPREGATAVAAPTTGKQLTREDRSSASSNTSLEVSEILEGSSRKKSPVAEERPSEEAPDEVEIEEEVEIVEDEDEEERMLPADGAGGAAAASILRDPYDSNIWPPAPNIADLDVSKNHSPLVGVLHTSFNKYQGEGAGAGEPSASRVAFNKESSPKKPASVSLSPRLSRVQQDDISRQLLEVQAILKVQQLELQELRQEVKLSQAASSSAAGDLLPSIRSHLDSVGASMKKHFDQSLAKRAQADSRRYEQTRADEQQLEKSRQDRLIGSISHNVSGALCTQLEKSVKTEMKSSVVPALNKSLEPMKQQILTDISQKLTTTDSLLKDSISKLVRSKGTVDAIGQAAGHAILSTVQQSYQDAFHSSVTPAFERACQNLFVQMNETFQKGTREYMQQLENYAQKQTRAQQDAKEPVVAELKKQVAAFQKSSEQLSSRLLDELQTNVNEQLQGLVPSLQEALGARVCSLVKDELQHAMKDQQAIIGESLMTALRSGAATPVPTQQQQQPVVNVQQQREEILTLLQQRHFNTAFQQALSAANLSLVIYACEMALPAHLFEELPCPLQQPVLLSLIQQLSADLVSNTELKHRFLEEAVMNLDMSHSVTREHGPAVLTALRRKLAAFIEAHPGSPLHRAMKMLMLASQTMLASTSPT
ncbi:PREDICTED: enhancer of mRNA-decapping protein 4-like isoform X2 [Priapulus caudatus]|uniref:Enhancer of mRNA-decapping protein 4-like isoform X2 n=1 Tax=Priapulus caudatus TaxID=37621 RepID=A0ABM1F8N2_PRICU|nr:PREDICTED: enhancer of mRNA-decapping protein 4-like isoform X2 [Priapulus caudatus]